MILYSLIHHLYYFISKRALEFISIFYPIYSNYLRAIIFIFWQCSYLNKKSTMKSSTKIVATRKLVDVLLRGTTWRRPIRESQRWLRDRSKLKMRNLSLIKQQMMKKMAESRSIPMERRGKSLRSRLISSRKIKRFSNQ